MAGRKQIFFSYHNLIFPTSPLVNSMWKVELSHVMELTHVQLPGQHIFDKPDFWSLLYMCWLWIWTCVGLFFMKQCHMDLIMGD